MHIGLSGWQREAAGNDHQALLTLFKRADVLGFDSIWLAEYHFRRSGLPYPSPLLLAAATFAVTERIRVGTGVVLVPHHHPLLLAEDLAQLDQQSGGRLDVGIGRGNDDAALSAIGIDSATKHERFMAGYDVLTRAWTEGRVASNDGPWQFSETEVGPTPLQQPHPPIYVAGTSEETVRFAVERRLPHLFSLEPPEDRQFQRWREVVGMDQALAELDRSSLARYLFIGRTTEEAHERLDRALLTILRRRRSQPVDVTDREAVARARSALIAQQAIVGTPDQCVDKIENIAREIGTGHLRLTINALGGLNSADTLEQLELFGRVALAYCRNIVPSTGNVSRCSEPALSRFPPIRGTMYFVSGSHMPEAVPVSGADRRGGSMADKRSTLAEVVASIRDGSTAALGGNTLHRAPAALVHELVRQGKRDLHLVKTAGAYDIDLLCGVGSAASVAAGFVGYETVFGLAPLYRRAVESGTVEAREHACYTIIAGLRAASQGVPFMPLNGLQGSDLVGLRGFKSVADPYTDQQVLVVPAIVPDVALIHVQMADQDGNCRIDGSHFEDVLMARAARRVIVTAERIVDREVLAADPGRTAIAGFLVGSVVEAPRGAWPTSCAGLYDYDETIIGEMLAHAGDPEGLRTFVEGRLLSEPLPV